MGKKVLIVDDEKLIVKGIRFSLEQDNMEVDCAYDGEEALNMVKEKIYDLILLDVMLPKYTGFEVCQMIREFSDVPVIMLTAKNDDMDKILGLEYGADDYITKPFHIAVLESRIQAVLRRVARENLPGASISREHSPGGHASEGEVREREDHNELICGEIRLDKQKMQVYSGDENIVLTSLEYRLLLMLMENKGCILPRNRILEKIWDIDGNFVNDNTLTVAIKRLREKLGQAACITTVRRIGYRMEEKK